MGFGLDAFMQGRGQQAPAADEAGDETPEMMDSFQWGAMDASSAPMGRAETVEVIS